MIYTATYSPDDNKIRLTASQRLDQETYARVKAAGFKWAPKLEQFIAPMWTPAREDLALELTGESELSDDDSSLAARAEERAERFDDYSAKRLQDAERAADAVHAIADNIPLGQPILIGHHSEKHARRDQQRIENGMRKAVKMWETSTYWTRRAAAALAHAERKERPDVRARRIKVLEAAFRKMEKGEAENARKLRLWEKVGSREQALAVANYSYLSMRFPLADYPRDPPASQYEGDMDIWSALDGNVISWDKARELAVKAYSSTRHIEHYRRWKAHYEGRLSYERAMLAEQGGTVADQTRPEKGGAVMCWVGGGRYCEIQKVNPTSVSVLDNYGNGGKDFLRTVPFDKLREVISRAAWLALQGKPADTPQPTAPKPGPICNYRLGEGADMTEDEWKRCLKHGAGQYVQMGETADHGRHKMRRVYRGGSMRYAYITDLPVKAAPAGVPFEAPREAVSA